MSGKARYPKGMVVGKEKDGRNGRREGMEGGRVAEKKGALDGGQEE